MTKLLELVIVTSASWVWTFNEAEIRRPEGGFIVGVSVDDAGRAEGYHERPDIR
jgi:hypothetical protein